LLPCIAWLVGAGLAVLSRPSMPLALAASSITIALGTIVAFRTRRLARAVLLPLAGAALVLGVASLEAERARGARLFGETKDVLETEILGSIARAPERAFDGTRVVVLDGRRAADVASPSVRLRLRITASAAGASLDDLVRGDRVRVWCRLVRPGPARDSEAPDPETLAAARGITARGSVKSARLLTVESRSWGVRPFVDRLRRAARLRLDRALGDRGPARALTAAMLLGDRELLEPRTLSVLRDAGLVHVVAISGLQVTLVALALGAVLSRGRLPRPLVLVVVLVALAAFGELVGAEPSVLRAIGAAIVLVAGRALGRDGDALNSLALVVLALVVFAPCSIADPALQLSVAATAGIVVGARRISARLPLPRPLALSFGATIGAYLATLPIVAWWFARLAPIALVTNLAAAPLSAAALALGYPALALADVPLLGDSMLRLAALPNELLLSIAARAASHPGAGIVVAPPDLARIVAYYTLLVIFARRPRPIGCAALALSALAIHLGPPPARAVPRPPEITVLDVGQGQAVAVRDAQGETVLVDAAGSADPRYDPGERIVVPWLVRHAGPRVSILSVSHEHADHAGGAHAVLRDLEVGALWLPVGWQASPRLADLAALARRHGAAVVLAERGASRKSPLPLDVLGPSRRDARLSANDRSIVLRIGARPCRLLVPADLDPPGEASLVRSAADLSAEALIVSHHGSRNGSSRELLERVRPRWAIVSCGLHNRFGHPHPEALARLRAAGARVRRTDRDGTVTLSCGATGFEPISRPPPGAEAE
jgi:competence protein ComEC